MKRKITVAIVMAVSCILCACGGMTEEEAAHMEELRVQKEELEDAQKALKKERKTLEEEQEQLVQEKEDLTAEVEELQWQVESALAAYEPGELNKGRYVNESLGIMIDIPEYFVPISEGELAEMKRSMMETLAVEDDSYVYCELMLYSRDETYYMSSIQAFAEQPVYTMGRDVSAEEQAESYWQIIDGARDELVEDVVLELSEPMEKKLGGRTFQHVSARFTKGSQGYIQQGYFAKIGDYIYTLLITADMEEEEEVENFLNSIKPLDAE